ncbi:Uncharacterised protein [Mycobacterium tuberculosis]|nr:Uncharacterised protein [Mycobacterium tuberculosis]
MRLELIAEIQGAEDGIDHQQDNTADRHHAGTGQTVMRELPPQAAGRNQQRQREQSLQRVFPGQPQIHQYHREQDKQGEQPGDAGAGQHQQRQQCQQ